MPSASFVPVATVERGGLPESWHLGAAAVATPEGKLVSRLGDPHLATFFRSSAKPFQAIPLLAAGGEERFALSDADLAVVCASHSGTPAHVERVRSLLKRGGFGPQDLLCGVHPPFDAATARRLRREGKKPAAVHNNCSGKHAGMLLACRLLELPTEDYLSPEHPLQRRILDQLRHCCRMPAREIGIAVDGCSAPTFHLPLAAAARAYGTLAAPSAAELPEESAAALERIVQAMARAPEMLAGPGRFTTRLAQVTGGRVLGKEGAEGIYCMVVRGPAALGVALKVADGSERARDGVAMELLRQIGSLSGREFDELADFYHPEIRNHRGILVGRIVPDLELARP